MSCGHTTLWQSHTDTQTQTQAQTQTQTQTHTYTHIHRRRHRRTRNDVMMGGFNTYPKATTSQSAKSLAGPSGEDKTKRRHHVGTNQHAGEASLDSAIRTITTI